MNDNQDKKVDFADDLMAQFDKKLREVGEDYFIDQDNCKKFIKCYLSLLNLISYDVGSISKIEIDPEMEKAFVTADIEMIDLDHNQMKKFLDILDVADTLDITASEEWTVLLTAGVYGVWKRR